MTPSRIGAILVSASLCCLFASEAAAHPASGIVVNAKGEVLFIHTGHGVCKIDSEGKLTYIHRVSGGGHFLALDAAGRFSTQFPKLFERVTPEGVKPALLYASGGAPLIVSQDGNLYYGSGYPGGEDTAPGGLTLTQMTPERKQTLFAPDLKPTLAKLKEAVTGLAGGPDGSLYVACPNALLKVKTDGTVTTLVHPVNVKDCDDVFGHLRNVAGYSESVFFHAPYLRGLDVTDEGTVYAAATGCRCVVKISKEGKVETVLKAEKPWTPTGVAVSGKDVFVLEYAHHDDKPEKWAPRVRKLGPDGRVTVLADLARDEKKPQR
jgi:hypothetical protein